MNYSELRDMLETQAQKADEVAAEFEVKLNEAKDKNREDLLPYFEEILNAQRGAASSYRDFIKRLDELI